MLPPGAPAGPHPTRRRKQTGIQSIAHHDPGTHHGFHNDTTPHDDEAAAKLAGQRTLEFFNKEIGGK